MPYIFMTESQERIKMQLTLNGITEKQQETLWDYALGPDDAAWELYLDSLLADGATYTYTQEEVVRKFGKLKPLWKILLGL